MNAFCEGQNQHAVVMTDQPLLAQGLALIADQKFDAAVAVLRSATIQEPNSADAWNTYGSALQHLGQYSEAVETHWKAVELDPEFAGAHNNLGVALSALGHWGAAFDAFDRALGLDAGNVEAADNRSAVLRAMNAQVTGADAEKTGMRSLAALAVRYYESERYVEALAFLTALIALRPGDLDSRLLHLNVLLKLDMFEEASAAIEQVLAIDPVNIGILEIEVLVLQRIDKLDRAHRALKRLIELKPDLPRAAASAIHFAILLGDWDELPSLKVNALRSVENDEGQVSPLILCHLTSSAALQLKGTLPYVVNRAQGITPMPPRPVAAVAGRKLKIGYLSADYRNHPVAYLMAEVIEAHDRERFDIIGYSIGPNDESRYRKRLRAAFGDFANTEHLNDEAFAHKIRHDGIDVLVDLTGYTKDGRPRVLAFRPAPVQINYLGYPGTMGAAFVDYIIADPIVIPPGAEGFYSEKIVRLPHCYQPNDRFRLIGEPKPTRKEAGLPENGVVFANLAQLNKINPESFSLWMQVLAAVPGSVMWLLAPRTESGRYTLKRAACDCGIDPMRIVFAPRVPPEHHLGRLHLADLVLDTFPYTSHTTASEYLMVDTPVLTIEGEDSFASRVCASILHHLGTDELIARSAEDFVTRAIGLGLAPAELTALREKIARCRVGNILFDGTRFARSLERVYVRMVERAAAALPPEGFDLEA